MFNQIQIGDTVRLIIMKTEGVVIDTTLNRVQVSFEDNDSLTQESTCWFDRRWVRKTN